MDSEAKAVLFDREAILERISHRPPFLFVDRILCLDDKYIESEWDVRPDAPFFEGHYPHNPIVPGVLLSEFAFQTAAVFIGEVARGAEGVPVLSKIENARYRAMVRPDSCVLASLTLDDNLASAYYMTARLSESGRSVLRISFVVTLA